MATIYIAIWQDKFVSLGTSDSIFYRISKKTALNSWEVVYTGKAYKRPGEANITIRLNDILADFLTDELPDSFSSFSNGVSETFKVSTSATASGTYTDLADTYIAVNDWSYIAHSYSNGVSEPINGKVFGEIYLPFSVAAKKTLTLTATLNNGTTETSQVVALNGGTAFFNLDSFSLPVVSASILGHNYKVVDGCHRYGLYYLNAFGGWDFFVIEGNTTESDSLTRHTRSARYSNTSRAMGKVNFVNEIAKEYTFHTGWLSDDEASRMHHLLNSPRVYLYDDEEGAVTTPLILTNSTTEYKTYKTNGGLVNYEITAEVADYRVRK